MYIYLYYVYMYIFGELNLLHQVSPSLQKIKENQGFRLRTKKQNKAKIQLIDQKPPGQQML